MISNFKNDLQYAEATELAVIDTLVAITNDLNFIHIEYDANEESREMQLKGTDILNEDIVLDVKSVASYRKSFSLELGNSSKNAKLGWICPEKEVDTDILILAFQLPKGRADNYSYWINKDLIKTKEDIEEQYLIFLDMKKLVTNIDNYIKEHTRFEGTLDLRKHLMEMSKEDLKTKGSLKYDMNLNPVGANDKPSPMYVSVSGRVNERAMNIVCETDFMRKSGAVITEFGVGKEFMEYQSKVAELLNAKYDYEQLMDENLNQSNPEILEQLNDESLLIKEYSEADLSSWDKNATPEESQKDHNYIEYFQKKMEEALNGTHLMNPEKEAKIKERGSVKIDEEFASPKLDTDIKRIETQTDMFKQMGEQLYENMHCDTYNKLKENEITLPYVQEAIDDYKDAICRLNVKPSEYDKNNPDANPKFWKEEEWAEYLSSKLDEDEIDILSSDFPFITEYIQENEIGRDDYYDYLPW